MEGLVVKSTGSWITIRNNDGVRLECKLKGQFKIHGKKATNPVAVGDRVEFHEMEGQGIGLITEIKARHNYIIRKATKLAKIYHVIAANLDQAFLIVTVALPRTSTGFIDRFLTTTEAYHIPASLVFNKIDIYDKDMMYAHDELFALYSHIGYPCYSVSAVRGDGIPELADILKDNITLMSGHSGVGKTAIINALQPDLNLRVGTLSGYHEKGKHTTTFAEMIELKSGGFIVDTPGIKEFGLSDFRKEEVAERFPEMRELMDDCQFNNCTHIHEPKCAVKDALDRGEIALSRYKNYVAIVQDEDMEEFDWETR